MNKNKMSKFVLFFVKFTGVLPALVFFKPKKYYMSKNSPRRLPAPCILMSNHTSLKDFVFYLVTFPFCTLRFWMAEVLFTKNKFFSWFLFKLGGILVNRDVCDFSFLEESVAELDKKGRIGVFPQGRLPVNGRPFPFKPGIVLTAIRHDAPIIPMYTDGNYGLFKRTHLMIGDPIYLRQYAESEDLSEQQIHELTKMLEEVNNNLREELEKRLAKK